jgi:integrase
MENQEKPKGKRPRGTGSIYWRGETLWIKYYDLNGKPHRESSHSDIEKNAERLLKLKQGEIAEGKLPGIQFDRITFDDLAKDFITDYRVNGLDTLNKAERSVRYLRAVFGGRAKAISISTDRIKAYTEKRMGEGLSNASINRELAALKRMFHLGAQCTPPRVSMIPYIPMLKESNIRKGFFEFPEHLAIKSALPSYLKPVVSLAFHSGWRKEEILSRTIDKLNMNERTLTLAPGETKNEEGRTFYMNDEVLEDIKAALESRNPLCPYLFQRDGEQIKDFRGAWESACLETGFFKTVRDEQGNENKVVTKLFHDYRRSAIRDMVRSGIPERVAMKISGHKTRSVFDRYNIVSDQDLKEAAVKKQAYHDRLSKVIVPFKRAENE